MLNQVSKGHEFISRLLIGVICIIAIGLLFSLAIANANTNFFEKYYSMLYTANGAMAVLLFLVIAALIGIIFLRLRQKRFGTRLLAKLAIYFSLVGLLPGSLIYLVSLQFVSRSIETWFDLNVEKALDAGLGLGRDLLSNSLEDLRRRGNLMAEQLVTVENKNTILTLLRLRDQFNIQEATIFALGNNHQVAVVAHVADKLTEPLYVVPPSAKMLGEIRFSGYSRIEEVSSIPMPDSSSNLIANETVFQKGILKAPAAKQTLPNMPHAAPEIASGLLSSNVQNILIDQDNASSYENNVQSFLQKPLSNTNNNISLRVIIAIPASPNAAFGPQRFLEIRQAVPVLLAQRARIVELAYQQYQEKSLGRLGLRKMYIGTLTLTLFLAIFVAILLALALGNQLTRPLFLLSRGTEEVARGDFTPKHELKTKDELGLLTQAFNAMTRQLSEARMTVEKNSAELEQSRAYLESVLSNLNAGVLVCNREFKLITVNAAAERILRQSFESQIGCLLNEIPAIKEFAEMVQSAFIEYRFASEAATEQSNHWQKQYSLSAINDTDQVTLLVRGARLTHSSGMTYTGYVIVFDDISNLISAQRSVAWGEVAQRLAHEIKNPLTPIQLSAERLQIKLENKLSSVDAEILRKGTKTIVNQVDAMKQMVNDFKEFARTPPANLQSLQLNDLVAEVLQLYGIEDARGVIQLKLDQTLPIILGDATQLRQVIHNLLQNALDAVANLPEQKVCLETKAVEYRDLDNAHSNRAVQLEVRDNGGGFSPKMLARACEPYVTTKSKGTGLGLAMVKKIVEEHGARFDIRNINSANDDNFIGAKISILFLQLFDSITSSNN